MHWIPPLTALRAFEAAGRFGIARAAKELNVTPAAISHQIRVLESELGTALFVRSGQGLVLTVKGQEYLAQVAASFEALHDSSRRLKDPSRGGRLVVSSLTSFAADFLAPRLYRFHAAHPDIDLEFHTVTRRFERVNFELTGANVAIRGGGVAGEWQGFRAEKLTHEIHFPVCNPELAKTLRKPSDLASQTLLDASAAPEGWRDWLAAAQAQGHDVARVRLDRAVRFDLFNMSMAAAAHGLGVDLGRAPLVDHWLHEGRLVAPFDLKVTSKLAYWLICPEEMVPRPEFKAFRGWLFSELEAKGSPSVPRHAPRRRRKTPP